MVVTPFLRKLMDSERSMATNPLKLRMSAKPKAVAAIKNKASDKPNGRDPGFSVIDSSDDVQEYGTSMEIPFRAPNSSVANTQ
jgi:hypothetical protein